MRVYRGTPIFFSLYGCNRVLWRLVLGVMYASFAPWEKKGQRYNLWVGGYNT
jgi:hypothetical protein